MKLLNHILLFLFKLGLSIKKPISGSYRTISDYDYHYPWRGGEVDIPMQWFSDDNTIKEGNKFTILTKKEIKENWNYTNKVVDIYKFTSGLMYSKEKFMYGSFEADILIPEGYGLWSAFWLHGGLSNPRRFGEIDIFEYYGKEKKFTYNTHFGVDYDHNQSKGAHGIKIPKLENSWHKYRLDWFKGKNLRIYIDDKLVGIRSSEGTNLPMKLIFNMAIEEGIVNELDKFLPTKMLIKNIKYYD